MQLLGLGGGYPWGGFWGHYAILYHLPPKNFRFLNRLFANPPTHRPSATRKQETLFNPDSP
jgi:hypothetical protein